MTDLGSNLEVTKVTKGISAPPSKPVGMPEMVKIILEESDSIPPTGQFFGLNGKTWMLRAGVEAEVPRGIIDILDNAVETRPIIDPSTKRTVGYSDRRRYSYRRV